MPDRKPEQRRHSVKYLKMLLGAIVGFLTITYVIFQFNLDMKLVEVLYNLLHKFHDYKDKDRDIAF